MSVTGNSKGACAFSDNGGAGRQAKVQDAGWSESVTGGTTRLLIGCASREAVASAAPLKAWRNCARSGAGGRAASHCPFLGVKAVTRSDKSVGPHLECISRIGSPGGTNGQGPGC